VDQAVGAGVRAQRGLLRVGFGVQVAEGEDDGVGEERARTARQPDPLPALARPGDAHGAVGVVVHGDLRRQRGHRPVVGPAQIRALDPAADEGVPVEAGPLVQGGALPDGSGHLDAGVGEHGDVLGAGVHPQQRRLLGPPDPSGARRVGVDEVDVEARSGRQFGGVGGDPLQDAGPARPRPDDDQGRPHRTRSVPRAKRFST
jgi:hypothetical protein